MKRQDAAVAGFERQSRREQIVMLLRAAAEPLSIARIADELGVHPNTVRFHLDALVDAERIEPLLGVASGPGRPPIVYRMRRTMNRNGPSNYRLLATMLANHLASSARNPARTATEVGREWGPSVVDRRPFRGRTTKTEALTRMVDVLAELGFEPEPHRGARTRDIRLRHCPFLDLYAEHAEVICSVHLGLMQGALAGLDAPVTVDRLEPFVEPDLCVAHLASTSAVTSGSGSAGHD